METVGLGAGYAHALPMKAISEERPGSEDRLAAVGADGDQTHLASEQPGDSVHVATRIRREVRHLPRARRVRPPARQDLVDGLGLLENPGFGRKFIDLFPAVAIRNAHGKLLEDVQYIEQCESRGGQAVDGCGVASGDAVEPAAAPR